MLVYVKEARDAYDAQKITKAQFLERVIQGAIDAAKKQPKQEMVVARATKILIDLSIKKNPDYPTPISRKEIRKQADFEQYSGYGLWPWYENQANVVKREPGSVQIKEEFYQEMKSKVLRIVKDY